MLDLRVQKSGIGEGCREGRRGGGARNCYGYLCFRRRRHFLITFVGMTLLIVSYGVNTVQMSSGPSGHKVASSGNISVTRSDGNTNDDGNGNDNASSRIIIMNGNAKLLHKNALLVPRPEGGIGRDIVEENQRQSAKLFINFRKSRLFLGLLGTNYSLSYNLTIGTGTTAGNVTVVAAPAPAPAYYYYAPAAPYYPYAYGYGYNPYAYNPYAYSNPYAYNPYAPSYYG